MLTSFHRCSSEMFLKNYDRQQWPAAKSKKKRLKKVPKKEREKKKRGNLLDQEIKLFLSFFEARKVCLMQFLETTWCIVIKED